MEARHPGNTCLKTFRHLPMVAALSLLTACGSGGGSSTDNSANAYRLPYTQSSTFHLLNTSTLADSPRQERQPEAWFPYQAQADGRLVVMPASHVFIYDDNRAVRQALNGNSASFSFPAGCDLYYENASGRSAPSMPWAVMNCGTPLAPDIKLVDLMANSGDGIIGAADLSEVARIELLAGTWNDAGVPSGLIAAQMATSDSSWRLFRYSSSDWAHPEPLSDTGGLPMTADDGWSLLGATGEMAKNNRHLNIKKAAWLEASNGASKTWYRVTGSADELQLEAVPASINLNSTGTPVLNDGALYYTKTSGGTVSLYRLDKSGSTITEQKLATASGTGNFSISIEAFTPTRVIWFDRVEGNYATLKSTRLDSSGSTDDTQEIWSDSHSKDSRATAVFVHDETVYFSTWSHADNGLTESRKAQSDGSGPAYLGEGVLFRTGFAGINSGTAQDDGRLYRAHADNTGTVTVASGNWPGTAENFVTLGSASGYTTQTCTDNLLWLNLALTPPGKQFITIDCAPAMGDGGFFWFKPGRANSLTPLKPVTPLNDGWVHLMPSYT